MFLLYPDVLLMYFAYTAGAANELMQIPRPAILHECNIVC